MNLYNETLSRMDGIGKSIEDIDYYIISEETKKWDEGKPLTLDTHSEWQHYCEAFADYDNGYGGNEVPTETFIVFKDKTWLSRGEYDGAEWWDYNTCPERI